MPKRTPARTRSFQCPDDLWREVEALARHHPLYLLTHHEGVPFVQDGIRDGEAIREWMTGRFLEALAATGRRFVVLCGSLESRVSEGLAAIDDLLAEGWGLHDPVTPPNGSGSIGTSAGNVR